MTIHLYTFISVLIFISSSFHTHSHSYNTQFSIRWHIRILWVSHTQFIQKSLIENKLFLSFSSSKKILNLFFIHLRRVWLLLKTFWNNRDYFLSIKMYFKSSSFSFSFVSVQWILKCFRNFRFVVDDIILKVKASQAVIWEWVRETRWRSIIIDTYWIKSVLLGRKIRYVFCWKVSFSL